LEEDELAPVRLQATIALGRTGVVTNNVVSALAGSLRDTAVAFVAGNILMEAAPHTGSAVQVLIETFENSEGRERIWLALALGHSGSTANEAVPAFVEVLTDLNEDNMTRGACAAALGKLGADAKVAVPALIEALKDDDEQLRSRAASALGKIGPDAKDALPALNEALNDRDNEIREQAEYALRLIKRTEQQTNVPMQAPIHRPLTSTGKVRETREEGSTGTDLVVEQRIEEGRTVEARDAETLTPASFLVDCELLVRQGEDLELEELSLSPSMDARLSQLANGLRGIANRLAAEETEKYTAEQAAPLMRLSPASVRRYCHTGVLQGEKVGGAWFLPKSEIDRYNRERRRPGKPRKAD